MNIIECPSPNCDDRSTQPVDMLVLHYTGMQTAEGARQKLCDVSARVSSHYLVDEEGLVYRLVPEKKRAWHAGVSYWRGNTNINQRSIGIEIVNPGHEYGYRPFTDAQMQSTVVLCKGILSRHPIPARNVVGHSDVAPARKNDPGELFNWELLAQEGIGLWPTSPLPPSGQWAQKLKEYGYDTVLLEKTILAFQRHFRPKNLTGRWDDECDGLLASLLSMV